MNEKPVPVRFSALKRWAALILCSNAVGWLLGVVYRNRIPFRGVSIDLRTAMIRNSTKARLFFGMYESAEYRFVNQYLVEELPTVELGASIGAVSSQIGKRLRPGTELTCVEANPNLIDTLSTNLSINAGHLKTRILPAAIAYDSESIEFAVSEDNRVSSRQSDANSMMTPVDAIRLGNCIPEGDFQLVCDIEGAEAEILAADTESLTRCRVAIVELHDTIFHGKRVSVQELASQFQATGLEPIDRYGSVYVFRRSS